MNWPQTRPGMAQAGPAGSQAEVTGHSDSHRVSVSVCRRQSLLVTASHCLSLCLMFCVLLQTLWQLTEKTKQERDCGGCERGQQDDPACPVGPGCSDHISAGHYALPPHWPVGGDPPESWGGPRHGGGAALLLRRDHLQPGGAPQNQGLGSGRDQLWHRPHTGGVLKVGSQV